MLGSYTAEGLQKTNNLSDLANAATARTNLGLGSAAAATVGNSAGDLPALQSGGVFPQAVIPPDVSEFNTIFVCTGGNDSTAKAYSRMYPFATIGAALAVAQPGDLVSVSAGCFDLGAGNLFVPSGVNVKGSGNCHGNISLVGSGTAADGNFTGPVPDAFSMTPQAAGGFATYNGFPYLFGVQQNWYIWNNGGGNWILSQTLGSLTASSYWKSSGADINGTYALNLVAGDAATGTAQIELTGGTIICSTRPSSGAGASSSGAVMTFGGANLISDLCIFAMAGTLSSASACNAIGATASTDDTIPAADVYFQNFSAHASRTAFSLTDAPPSDLFATVAWTQRWVSVLMIRVNMYIARDRLASLC
ncbi:MAG TPA: DUF1565 domain-containing protein [Tepidisphaeraceae bacterium]|jgi:hypothetical protein|nr:DUF1565 domain-containing protein [Tepidisphaeraceae bacterium]